MRWTWSLLVVVAFAGCLDGPHDLDEDTFSLEAEDVPDVAVPGEPFTFRLVVEGDLTMSSDHIGAHYWDEPTDDPSGDFGAVLGGCQHVAQRENVPGTFDVECTFEEGGAHHLRGHLRIENEGDIHDYWTDGHVIQVGTYELTGSKHNGTIAAGEDFTFELQIAGPSGTSDHAGGHYWSDPVDDPTASFGDKAGDCAHVDGEAQLPGTFTVTCTFSEAGQYTLHGHLRLGSGDSTSDFWTSAMMITVT